MLWMRSRVKDERPLKSGDFTVNIGDRFCEGDGYSVSVNGKIPGLDDLCLPLGSMVQYLMCEDKNGKPPDGELNG